MGKTRGQYKAEYSEGEKVKIAPRADLEHFLATWKFHNKLTREQLAYADYVAEVASIEFYHGGDELYRTQGSAGIWREAWLERLKST